MEIISTLKRFLRRLHKQAVRELRIVRAHIKKVPLTRKEVILLIGVFFLVCFGLGLFWLSSLKIPNLNSFDSRRVAQSTKIYDKTGTVLLYDIHEGVKRTIVPSANISDFIKKATVAIEDAEFYQHHGIKPTSIIRAIISNIESGCLTCGQGGSTITQQVVKNALLTNERALSRKIKEWVLALKLEKVMTKDEILTTYLNESPYGGNIYGVEEAAQAFFKKHASEVTLAQAAYLAAVINAPTYYSPYGKHKSDLDERQQFALVRMKENGFITDAEYQQAITEQVTFEPQDPTGIKAPHFVNYIIDELTRLYGAEGLEQGGMRVITTLDYDLQQKAEELVKKYALENEQKFKASNAGLVALDPRTGGILVMVGSRDYFDKAIDGNFNITTAPNRQPGSTMKPIVYATGFKKGYEPETVLFDAKTEFVPVCPADGSQDKVGATACYHPQDFDSIYKGPMDIRHALAQSRNIPAVKMLYLAGVKDSLQTAKDMGITTFGNAAQYGLTLVLGSGSVSPLELTSAYTTFANGGQRVPYEGIQRIEDPTGKVIKEYHGEATQALPKQVALKIADILQDYPAKDPNPYLDFNGRQVASKTGTTNDYRDAWIMGFTPSITVGVWTGNNDNTPMQKQVAGYIAAPLWSAFMHEALKTLPVEEFEKPEPEDLSQLKPILRGGWQGGTAYVVDKITGNLATDQTPPELRETRYSGGAHTILYFVDKSNPLGPPPANPASDAQYEHWEYGVQAWLAANGSYSTAPIIPTQTDTVHTGANAPRVGFLFPASSGTYRQSDRMNASITHAGPYPLSKVEYSLNGVYVGASFSEPFGFSFVPQDNNAHQGANALRAVATDSVGNKGEMSVTFFLSF